jgi:hypothetical protein
MYKELITWDIYEIRTGSTQIVDIMFRGRVRKFCLERGRNVLVENTQDVEKCVRFAIPSGEDSTDIKNYLKIVAPDVSIELVKQNIPNPILSKLKVNIESRYTL